MAGFPNRVRRTTLGPALEDVWPVTDERKAIPARTFNLAWWQLAGLSLTGARGLIGVRISALGVPTTFFQALAWDPDGALPLLAWTKSATGTYTFSFPQSSYPDEAGNPVTLVLLGGRAEPQTLIDSEELTQGVFEKTGARSGKVYLFSAGVLADMGIDGEFLVFLY